MLKVGLSRADRGRATETAGHQGGEPIEGCRAEVGGELSVTGCLGGEQNPLSAHALLRGSREPTPFVVLKSG